MILIHYKCCDQSNSAEGETYFNFKIKRAYQMICKRMWKEKKDGVTICRQKYTG